MSRTSITTFATPATGKALFSMGNIFEVMRMLKLMSKNQYCMHCRKKTKISLIKLSNIPHCSKCGAFILSKILEVEELTLNNLNSYEKELKKSMAHSKKIIRQGCDAKERKKEERLMDERLKYELTLISDLRKQIKEEPLRSRIEGIQGLAYALKVRIASMGIKKAESLCLKILKEIGKIKTNKIS